MSKVIDNTEILKNTESISDKSYEFNPKLIFIQTVVQCFTTQRIELSNDKSENH
jgi:hypothetical protein